MKMGFKVGPAVFMQLECAGVARLTVSLPMAVVKGTLGNSQKGISRPIEVKLRAKGVGLQDDGERTEQAREDFPNEADKEEKQQAVQQVEQASASASQGMLIPS